MKATFYVCKAMQASLSGKADGQQSSLGHCERASSHLWNSLNMSSGVSSAVLNNVRALSPGFCSVLVAGLGLLWVYQLPVVSAFSIYPVSYGSRGETSFLSM